MTHNRAGEENRLFNYDLCHALEEDINYSRRHGMDWDIGLKGTVGLWWPIPCCYQYLVRSFFIWTGSISRVSRLWEGWGFFWVHWPKYTNTAQHCTANWQLWMSLVPGKQQGTQHAANCICFLHTDQYSHWEKIPARSLDATWMSGWKWKESTTRINQAENIPLHVC